MNIIITIIVLWFVFFLTGVLTYGYKKTYSVNRYLFVVIGLGVFGILTHWIMFFPAWYFKDKNINPFWFWLDNSRLSDVTESGYSLDYEIYLSNKKETILTAYKWHLRNRIWNLDSLFKPKKIDYTEGNQRIHIEEYVYDDLKRYDGTKIVQDGIWEAVASLKYIKDGVSTWQTNQGQYISKAKSIIGRGFIWYSVGNWLGFRYSECKKVKFLFWTFWVTIKIGTNSKRYGFTIKFQKDKQWR